MSAFGGATDTADLWPKTRHFPKTHRVKTTPQTTPWRQIACAAAAAKAAVKRGDADAAVSTAVADVTPYLQVRR